MTRRPRVAILFGGCSEEHDVSVKSAMEIAASIDTQKYEPIYIGITRSGVWKMCERPRPAWDDGDCRRAVISPDRADARTARRGAAANAEPCTSTRCSRSCTASRVRTEPCRDCSSCPGFPYVGCDIQSSAICMDKSLAYVVARSAGIDTPAFSVLDGADTAAPNELAYPVFVKPARSGSSFGVTKVERADELDAAIAAARQYDSKVLIEQAIVGTEVGCAVLGNGADLIVGEVDQISCGTASSASIRRPSRSRARRTRSITVPADLPDEHARTRSGQPRSPSTRHSAAQGLARVDMFLQADGRIVLNEVNTLPGFTSYSRYPRMMAAAGIGSLRSDRPLISLAMAR